jgi:hypothetical protein
VQNEALTARSAADLFGRLRKGAEVFALSKGYVSFGEAVGYLLETAGPADVLLSTWTIGASEIRGLRRLVDSGRIRALRLLVDPSFNRRHRAYAALLRSLFGSESVRLVKLHAKLACVVNDGWALVLRSSANLNANHRCEFFEVSDDRALASFICATLGEWFEMPVNWDASARVHAEAFLTWAEPVQVAAVSASRRDVTRPAAVTAAATSEDAAFFDNAPFGADLRRVGVSYL